MKLCLVTAFPPSRRGLNEYGYHIARELQRNPLLSLTILADHLEATPEELEDFSVLRCDPHQKSKALEPISRFRRILSWIPSRSAIFRAAAPRWSPWM